jgi:rhodanese-related sulfurtransferase
LIGGGRLPLGTRIALLVLLPGLLGVAANALRADRLPWVAPEPYLVLHDCPETTETAGTIAAAAALRKPGRLGFVDGSAADAFGRGHVKGAVNVSYDPLFPVAEGSVRALRDARATWILVYGGGGTGKPLADELASAGLSGVLWVQGDLDSLRAAGADVVSGRGRP